MHICEQCHLKTVDKLIEKFKPSASLAAELSDEIKRIITANRNNANPYLATLIQREVKQKLQITDLYKDEKANANAVLLANYSFWKDLIYSGGSAFSNAVKLALAGNIIDYAAHSVPDDIHSKILELISRPLLLHAVDDLYMAIQSAKKILYLGDNAGEIVFDKLLLETIRHDDVTFAVRGREVINDATMDDALQVGLDKTCHLINNGYDAPSTLLNHCSDEFMEAYQGADLIISKGQGNFEGLMDVKHENTYFLLTAKCQPIANKLGVKVGELVIRKKEHGI